jgi:hypothetical protein
MPEKAPGQPGWCLEMKRQPGLAKIEGLATAQTVYNCAAHKKQLFG